MKKMICMMVALAVCLSLVATVFATENEEFVPSITYKPSPEIVAVTDAEGNEAIGVIRNAEGEVMDYVEHGCLEITPIAHVWDPEVEVPEEVEKLLTFVYEELSEGKMEIPYDKHEGLDLEGKNMVVRDLFDARWTCDEHKDMVEEQGVYFEITFDLGIDADTPIYAMTYDEDVKQWSPVVKTVNNGDGTMTCTFEHLCAIEFSMPLAAAAAPAEDVVANLPIWPWVLILVVAVAAIVVIVISKKKKASAV